MCHWYFIGCKLVQITFVDEVYIDSFEAYDYHLFTS